MKLTPMQKLRALSIRFYDGMEWVPTAGDFYTTTRADLELYQIVEIHSTTDRNRPATVVRTRYTEGSDAISEWPLDGFQTHGFGPFRVWVPHFVLETDT